MKPSELRELAKWHAEIASELMIGSDEPSFPIEAIDEAGKYTQSARALNFLADVLEAEPVGFVTNEWSDPEEFAERGLECNGPAIQKAAIGAQLIIKPTFGDDK